MKYISVENGTTALMLAANKRYHKSVCSLINAGADVDTATVYGTTALMCTAQNGDDKSVRLLIEAGVDVNKVDFSRSAALSQAIIGSNHDSVLTSLMESGVDVNLGNE